jgi:hypothetical protein
MELRYLEINGILLPLTTEAGQEDANEDIVALVSEIMEHQESAESSCVALSTSGAF